MSSLWASPAPLARPLSQCHHATVRRVPSQSRHGKRSQVATDLSASIHLARAAPSPFSSHTKCNLQGRRIVPATDYFVFAGALGFAYPVPLGHTWSGSFQVQKDIWDAVTTEKNVIIFQITGQINDLSHLQLLPTATGP